MFQRFKYLAASRVQRDHPCRDALAVAEAPPMTAFMGGDRRPLALHFGCDFT